jgi:acetyl esterase/lipase
MRKQSVPSAAPFSDTSSLEAVRLGQSAFGARLGRVGGRMAAPGRREAGVFFEPAERRLPGTLLYLHGGGYVSGDGEYADGVASLLAGKLGIRVFRVSYRLAPEHPFPAALDDAEAAYRTLLRSSGGRTEQTAFLGDSSGGGLAFALALRVKADGLPQPAGIVAMSPWADLSLSGLPADGDDGMLTAKILREWAEAYAAGNDLRSPELSPLYGDLTGLPPALLLAGGDELLRSDAERLCAALHGAGVPAELITAFGMQHTYPLSGVRQSAEAFAAIASFLQKR